LQRARDHWKVGFAAIGRAGHRLDQA
jgi:hypothetical protein